MNGITIHTEIKSDRTENNICLVGGLQEYCDLTYVNSSKNKGFPCQEVCSNQPHPLHSSIKET